MSTVQISVGRKSIDRPCPYQWHSYGISYVVEVKIVQLRLVSGRDRLHSGHVAAKRGTYDFYRVVPDARVDFDQAPVVDTVVV